jgi:ankyrin repeat protein
MLFSEFEEPSELRTGGLRMRDSVVAGFFYSTRGGSMETSHRLMLQSLLYQILEQEPYLFELYREPFRRLWSKSIGRIDWSYDDLKKIFLSLALDEAHSSANHCYKIYLIVDAMDESEDQAGNGRQRGEILSLLSNLCLKEGKNIIKIIVASRPATEIEKNLKRCYHIELQRENSADIEKVVDVGLLSIWRSMNYGDEVSNCDSEGEAKDREMKNNIVDNSYMRRFYFVKEYLLKNAAGVVLWVTLIINNLIEFVGNGSHSMGEIKERLEALPSDLGEVYGGIVNGLRRKHNQDGIAKAQHMLNWVSFAKRPLTVEEFRDAIATPADVRSISASPSNFLDEGRIEILNNRNWAPVRRRMVFMCGGLLEVKRPNVGSSTKPSPRIQTVGPSDAVQLLHQTAKDFLVYNDHAAPLRLDQIEGENLITTTSINYLMRSLPMEVLRDKAIQQWDREDYKKFIEYLLDRPLLSYILSFLPQHIRNRRTHICDRVVQAISEFKKFLRQLHSQPDSHAWRFLELWCHQENLITITPIQSTTQAESFITNCLTTASRAGHASAVRSILGARANIEGQDSTGRKALNLAAEKGHDAIVKLLLEKGAQLESWDNSRRVPILWAAERGHCATMEQLLAKGANLEFENRYGRTPLSQAVIGGQHAMVKLLLEKGANLESKDNTCRTPLSLAARKRKGAMVKLLLEKGAQLESRDIHRMTPLSWAAERGYHTIVKLLLEKGPNLESKDVDCRTPLSWATGKQNGAVVKLLLQKGALLEAKDKNRMTPLSWAVVYGHDAVVKLLLERGADLESKDIHGMTPLSWVAGRGQHAAVKLLLEEGADLEPRDTRGRTPLSLAAEKPNDNVVKLLLEKRADLESRDAIGRTPLSRAAEHGHEAVVRLLLEKGADLESGNIRGQAPLSSDQGCDTTAQLLLEEGIDLESKDINTWTSPLSWAAAHGHGAVVKLLLEKGADLESRDIRGRTPLLRAAGNGHDVVVKLLLEEGVDLESKDDFCRTSLLCAAEKGHDAAVKLLLECGADLESKDVNGQTPLSRAAEKGHYDVVELLIEKGADSESKGFRDRTPLWWAATFSHNAVVKLLLEKGADPKPKDVNGRTPILGLWREGTTSRWSCYGQRLSVPSN